LDAVYSNLKKIDQKTCSYIHMHGDSIDVAIFIDELVAQL